jgi:hypothetical protein
MRQSMVQMEQKLDSVQELRQQSTDMESRLLAAIAGLSAASNAGGAAGDSCMSPSRTANAELRASPPRKKVSLGSGNTGTGSA